MTVQRGVFIALPAYDYRCYSATAVTLAFTTGSLVAKGFQFLIGTYSMPDIVALRNLFLTVWYDKTQMEWILFIDSDMEIEPDMVLSMLELDEPVVGAIYPKKIYPLRYVFNGDTSPATRVEHPRDERFLRVDGLGFGCTLIHRSAIEKMLAAGLPFKDKYLEHMPAAEAMKDWKLDRVLSAFDVIKTDKGELSEDLSFCRRWTQVNGVLWGAAGWNVGHVGAHTYRGCLLQELKS